MREADDFALLLGEYTRLKAQTEQLLRERAMLHGQVKTGQSALLKAQKALQRLKADQAARQAKARGQTNRRMGTLTYWALGGIVVGGVPLLWCVLLVVSLEQARWDMNMWALLAVLLMVAPLCVFLGWQRSRERQEWERAYQRKEAALLERASEEKQPAQKQREETARQPTKAWRAPMTRPLSEEALEGVA
jgi:formate hydrogenlyase subunit 3/multisubunit Na+/H+ antiporter MnhD subunit